MLHSKFFFKKPNSRSCTTTVLPSTLLDLSPVLTSDGASLRPAEKEREKRATPLESEATLPRSPTWRSVELGLPCTFCSEENRSSLSAQKIRYQSRTRRELNYKLVACSAKCHLRWLAKAKGGKFSKHSSHCEMSVRWSEARVDSTII